MGLDRKLMLSAVAALTLGGCNLNDESACSPGSTEIGRRDAIIRYARAEDTSPVNLFASRVGDCNAKELENAARFLERTGSPEDKTRNDAILYIRREEETRAY